MAERVLQTLWVLELLAVFAGLLVLVTGEFRQGWWLSAVAGALHLAQLLINAWVERPPRKREFQKPRSAYPNGDNGYNRHVRR